MIFITDLHKFFIKLLLMFSLILIYSLLYTGCKNESELSMSPVPATASQIENSEDLIKLLAEAKTEEERQVLFEENKSMIDSSFVVSLLVTAHNSFGEESLSTDKSKHLAQIAIEVSNFTGDKISLAKALRYNASFEVLEKKDRNPPSLQKALELSIEAGDRKGEASCYYCLARSLHYSFGETEEAFKLLDKASEIFSETGDEIFVGDCFFLRADIYRDMGDKENAVLNYKKAIDIYEEVGDVMSIIFTYKMMAITCEIRGFLEEAKEYLEEVRLLIEALNPDEIKDFSGKDEAYIFRGIEFESKDKSMSDYYMSLGQLYSIMGKYEEAIKAYKEAIESGSKSEKTGFPELLAYWSLGDAYLSLGQKDTALKYYLESIEKKERDVTGKMLIAADYMILGGFYLTQMKEPDEAMKYYEIAMEKSKEFEMKVFRDQYVALCIRSIGQVYEEKGEYDKAIEKMEESLKIFEKIYEDYGQFDYFLVWNYDLLGKVYHKKGDNEKALLYMNKALDFAKQANSLGNIATACNYLGEFYMDTEQYDLALEASLEGLKIAEELRSPAWLWSYYYSLGKTYEKMDNQEEAYKAYSKSIEVIENMRNELKVEEFKRDFMQDKIKVYENMIDLLIKMKREREAYEYNEKARARAFLDILANQKVDIKHGISPELVAEEEELRTRIQYLSNDIRLEKSKASIAQRSSFIEETDGELKDLKSEYEEVLQEIKLQNPEYMTFISVVPFKLEETQELLEEDTVILEYFLGEDKSFLWIIGKNSFNTVIIPEGREEIEEIVKNYREMACDNLTLEKLGNISWRDISKELYALLFKEAEEYLSGKKRVLIAPHRILHYLPFQVLLDEDEKFLVEKYEIDYLPSASVLKFCRDKNRLKKDSLLAFELGDFETGGFKSLPGTEEEVEGISALFQKKEVYSGKDMKKDIIYKKANKFDIIHFATHGIMDSEAPLFSGLVFAGERLNVYEIFEMELNSYMVCLSACSTGLSENANGDELVGLSRAFIYAGSPTICSSLWDVSDASTSLLMERFYFHLKDKNKSEALRLAQMEVMKKYPHPFFWAPFVIIGDYR